MNTESTDHLLLRLHECLRGRDDLRDYQDKLVAFLLANLKSAAWVDMGLGKTIAILTLLDILFWSGQMKRCLIVAPKRVALQTWPTEINEWSHTFWMQFYSLIRPNPNAPEIISAMKAARLANPLSPGHHASKARTEGQKAQMRRASQSDFPIHIINREQVAFLVEYWQERKMWPYDCIIIDESTSFADHSSKRWKAMAWACRRSERVHLLSGTPAPEGIADLFAQIYLLDGGERFGRSVTRFRKKYMDHNQYTKVYTPKEGAAGIVGDMCADLCIVMKEEDYLDRKKALVIERPILLTKAQLRKYSDFEETMLMELPDDEEIEAVNAGVLASKLLQFASGAVYGNDKVIHEVHDRKIEELHDLIDELPPGEPLMISYWFKSSLLKLTKAFPNATVMDKDGKCVGPWNAGKISMLLVHPQSAGHGLNMQKGPGHILVFFDTPASLELYLQICKRLDRSGQDKVVKIIHLVVRKTLDAFSVPRLVNKGEVQDEIVGYLSRLRKSFRDKRAPL